jgi:hypothetical protein
MSRIAGNRRVQRLFAVLHYFHPSPQKGKVFCASHFDLGLAQMKQLNFHEPQRWRKTQLVLWATVALVAVIVLVLALARL